MHEAARGFVQAGSCVTMAITVVEKRRSAARVSYLYTNIMNHS